MTSEAGDQWTSAESRTTFMHLRVGVADDTVYKIGAFGVRGAVLGPLAGAVAEVTDGTSRHTLTRVVSIVGAFSKKTNASAFVVTADGELVESKLEGAAQVRKAQAQAIKFNALALKAAQAAG